MFLSDLPNEFGRYKPLYIVAIRQKGKPMPDSVLDPVVGYLAGDNIVREPRYAQKFLDAKLADKVRDRRNAYERDLETGREACVNRI